MLLGNQVGRPLYGAYFVSVSSIWCIWRAISKVSVPSPGLFQSASRGSSGLHIFGNRMASMKPGLPGSKLFLSSRIAAKLSMLGVPNTVHSFSSASFIR